MQHAKKFVFDEVEERMLIKIEFKSLFESEDFFTNLLS